jgi:hypothetical protein
MKTLVINLAAVWAATISTFQDGDVFRESNIDTSMGTIADRLGALKTLVDGKAGLATANTWTNNNEFNTDSGTFQVTGSGDAEFSTPVFANATLSVFGVATFSDEALIEGGVALGIQALANANETIDATAFHARVPSTINAARTYTLPATTGLADGHSVNVERVDTTANIVTIQDPTGPTTVGQLSGGAAGWIEFIKRGSAWRVGRFGGAVGSLSTTS